MLKQLLPLTLLPVALAAMQPAMVLPSNPFVLPYADSRRSPNTDHPPVIQNLQDNVCVPLQDAAKSGDKGSFFYLFAPDNWRFEVFEFENCTNPSKGHTPGDAVFNWTGFWEWELDWDFTSYKAWTLGNAALTDSN